MRIVQTKTLRAKRILSVFIVVATLTALILPLRSTPTASASTATPQETVNTEFRFEDLQGYFGNLTTYQIKTLTLMIMPAKQAPVHIEVTDYYRLDTAKKSIIVTANIPKSYGLPTELTKLSNEALVELHITFTNNITFWLSMMDCPSTMLPWPSVQVSVYARQVPKTERVKISVEFKGKQLYSIGGFVEDEDGNILTDGAIPVMFNDNTKVFSTGAGKVLEVEYAGGIQGISATSSDTYEGLAVDKASLKGGVVEMRKPTDKMYLASVKNGAGIYEPKWITERTQIVFSWKWLVGQITETVYADITGQVINEKNIKFEYSSLVVNNAILMIQTPLHTRRHLYYTDVTTRADLRAKIEYEIEREIEGGVIPPGIVVTNPDDTDDITPLRTQDGKLIRLIGEQLFDIFDDPLIHTSNYLPVFFKDGKYIDWDGKEIQVKDNVLIGVVTIEEWFNKGNTTIAFAEDGITRVPVIVDTSVYPAKFTLLNGKDATPYIEETKYAGDDDLLRKLQFSNIQDWIRLIMVIVALVLFFILAIIVLPYIAPFIKVIVFVISIPFKAVKSSIKAIRKKRNEKNTN